MARVVKKSSPSALPPLPAPVSRTCLRCSKPFRSYSISNRICKRCNEQIAGLSRREGQAAACAVDETPPDTSMRELL
jgi:hypothetical protein